MTHSTDVIGCLTGGRGLSQTMGILFIDAELYCTQYMYIHNMYIPTYNMLVQSNGQA